MSQTTSRRTFLSALGLVRSRPPAGEVPAVQIPAVQCPMCLQLLDVMRVLGEDRPIVATRGTVTCDCGWSGAALLPRART